MTNNLRFHILTILIIITFIFAQDKLVDTDFECQQPKSVTFVKYSSHSFLPLSSGKSPPVIKTKRVESCSEYCKNNTTPPDNHRFLCAGFSFDIGEKVCLLLSPESFPSQLSVRDKIDNEENVTMRDAAGDFRAEEVDATDTGTYEKMCLREKRMWIKPGKFKEKETHEIILTTVMNQRELELSFSVFRKDIQPSVFGKMLKLITFKRCWVYLAREISYSGTLCASSNEYVPNNGLISFEKMTNKVLFGSTEHTVEMETLSDCLSLCLESVDQLGTPCYSVMYYYESGYCFVNSMNRRRSTLSPDTDGLRVDYFEKLLIGYQCEPGTVAQYVYLSNKDAVDGHDFVIEKVSRKTCENYCTSNRVADGQASICRAFAYREAEKVCYLMKEQLRPRGRTPVGDVNGVEIYEKVCLSAPQTCTKMPAFERIPDHVLVGFAQLVLENVPSEDLCLSECLSASSKLDFDCMSSMYYYDTKECILNYESRLAPNAKSFMTNNTEGYKVDYFDNLCDLRLRDAGQPLNTCPDRTASTFVQINGTELSGYLVQTFVAADLEECLAKCDTVKNFTCNSADYQSTDSTCSLSYVDSKTSPLVPAPSSSHFERLCIEGTSLCQAKPVSFDVEKGVQLIGAATLTVVGIGVEECLSLCLLDPTQTCRSINYNNLNLTCHLNNGTFFEQDDFIKEPNSDYYENKCFHYNPYRKTVISESLVGEVLAAQTGVEIQTQCLYSTMKVTLTAQQPFTGFVFAKNKFWSCGAQVQNSATAQLTLTFPTFPGAVSDCGVMEISKSKYSGIIVLTMNNLGIPGLVAEGDRFFNITCDYAKSAQHRVTATGPQIAVANPNNQGSLYPDGLIDIPSPVQIRMRKFASDQDGGAVHMVEVGEQVALDILYAEGFNHSLTDFFVRQCNASRHYGPPPDPEPLVLIKDGCPAPAVVNKIVKSPVEKVANGLSLSFTAFRFDGSNSVRVTCLVDLCEKRCNPTSCDINGQTVASYGRKKRASEITGNKVKQSETNSFVFTVVDHKSIENAQVPIFNKLDRLKHLQNKVSSFSEQRFVDSHHRKQLCLKRSTFFSVFLFLCLICLCQIVFICVFVFRPFFKTVYSKFH